MTPPAAPRFQVSTPQTEREKLKRWGEWAAAHGAKDNYVGALRKLNCRLSFEADDWGEHIGTLEHHAVEPKRGTVDMLEVTFGGHYPTWNVFIRSRGEKTIPVRGRPGKPITPLRWSVDIEQASRQAIRDHPEDDLPWLAYADWLEERGHTGEANTRRTEEACTTRLGQLHGCRTRPVLR